MSAIAPVSVNALRLVGDALHRDALLASLDDTHWPAAADPDIIILRRLQVRAPWWQAAELAGQDARSLAAGAVSGWDARAGDAMAVRFTGLADLLACLSHDLARGRAAALWYWHGWQRLFAEAPADAITRLCCEYPRLLPDLVAVLAQQQALAAVCGPLDPPRLARLMDAVRRLTGWSLPTPADLGQVGGNTVLTDLPTPRLADWRGPIHALPAPRLRALLPLLALASGWRQLPHRLHRPDHWLAWCATVARRLPVADVSHAAAPASPPPSRPTDPATGGTAGAHPSAASTGDPPAGATAAQPVVAAPTPPQPPVPSQHAVPAPAADIDIAAGVGSDRAPDPAADPAPTNTAPTAGPRAAGPLPQPDHPPVTPALDARDAVAHPAQPAGSAPQETITDMAADTRQPASGARFDTTQGGLFYLLNVLSHPAIAPCLADAGESGWHRLYRLGLHLGLDCDPPLARFLAHQLDLTGPGQLPELPPLGDERALLQLAERHYAHLPVWGPELLAVPAHVLHGHSHLDLYFPLSAVRLAIRRAGLDIDPGWLPWLGQVVHFHYREPPAGPEPHP